MPMRTVDSKLWESEPFKGLHTFSQKLVYLYLLTHPRINRKGRIPMGVDALVGDILEWWQPGVQPADIPAAERHAAYGALSGLDSAGLITIDSLTTEVTVAFANREPKKVRDVERIPYAEIVADLNEVCGKRHLVTEPTKRKIRARWADGFRYHQFEAVHRRMKDAADRGIWWPGRDMHDFLRPETLYSEKFEMYLTRDWEAFNAARGGDDMDGWAARGDG